MIFLLKCTKWIQSNNTKQWKDNNSTFINQVSLKLNDCIILFKTNFALKNM